MTREEIDFIGSMNMCDEISNEAYKKIVCHCEEQEPCEDAISRQAVIKCLEKGDTLSSIDHRLIDKIKRLPPVTQEPKTGHWIADVDRWGDVVTTINGYKCDKCNAFNSDKDNYCPNCGRRMVEPQESEDKE